MAKTEEVIEKIIVNPITELGYELYDIEYVKEGKDYFLRIYIDNQEGITLEDCEKVSNRITDILDKEDCIKEQYFLEISSPGIERVLKKDKHLLENIGNNIQVKLFKPFEGNKQYIGILKAFNNDEVSIFDGNNLLNIDRKNISQIKTIYNW